MTQSRREMNLDGPQSETEETYVVMMSRFARAISEEQVSRLDGIVSADRLSQSADQQTEIKEFLKQVLEMVPEQDRQLLILKEMQGLSVQELAEIFDLNANTMKVRLFRARGKIMEAYRRRVAPAHRGSISAAERKG